MTIIKWQQDKDEEYPSYELYVYVDTIKMQIGWLYWNELEKSWYMRYSIPRIINKFKKHEEYTINEVNDVLVRVVLDIQADLSFINNMCVDYCNAISDYAIDYIMGIDHNED